MILHTYWWGIILVPENKLDVDTLYNLDNSITECKAYEVGSVRWFETDDKFNKCYDVNLPMGKALEINR